jgi:hypothetical protein
VSQFLITEEEKRRILNLHIDATKKHYLLEQAAPTSVEEIKAFQDYMDTIGPWVKNKKTGKYYKLKKGGGYGNFGSNTSAAWKVYGKKYLESKGAGTEDTSLDSGGPGFESGVPAKVQAIKDGVNPSPFGASCTKVSLIGSFSSKVTTNSKNLTDFITRVQNELKTNEKIKSDYTSGKAYIAKIRLIGGASNRYDGKPVKPEMDNNYNVQTYPDSDSYSAENFDANKALATLRANTLYTELVKKLPALKLPFGKDVKPEILSYVIDTGGNVDSKRTSTYVNPGQVVIVEMDICATTTSTPDPKITELTDLGKKGFVLTGSYYCNGKNSQDINATIDDVWNPATGGGCTDVQIKEDAGKLMKDKPHMSAFEIKYKMNVSGSEYVVPVTRWKIFWDKNNKISKIYEQDIDKRKASSYPQKEVSYNDEYMRLAMRNGNPSTPETRWETYIKPFAK